MSTIIRDPKLEPFYIGKDAYCYTVYEKVTPQEKYLEKGSKGKVYEKTLGHYNKLAPALLSIVKGKLESEFPEEVNLKEYLDRYEEIETNIKELLNSSTL